MIKINKIKKKVLTVLIASTLIVSTFSSYYTPALAVDTVHVRIIGSQRTIWFGDVNNSTCSVTDTDNKNHVFVQTVAVCALDAASKAGGFSYAVKDFGGSLGLFLQTVEENTGASDFSTYWSYDLNGTSASAGISNQVVKNGDSLFFHFEDPNADLNQRALNDGITYLKSQQDSTGQISGFSGVTPWAVQAFAAGNVNPSNVKSGGKSLVDYIMENPPTASSAATEWERAILAITSAGFNPFSFGGTDYVTKLETYHNNSQLGSTTQVNDDVFGLLALISAGTNSPMQTKQDALNFILAHQNSDGGFNWSTTGESDVDDTAAALQALKAAQNVGLSNPNLSSAITNAKNFVLDAKNSDGGFPYNKGDGSNSSTTAWALMALSSLGVTGDDVNKAKNYLVESQDENGSFKWQSGSTGDTFTSVYAVHALTGKFWPVKIFVGVAPSSTPDPTPTATALPTPVPTIAPTPHPSVQPSVAPSFSPTPNPASEMIKQQQENLRKIQEQQREIFEKIKLQIQKELEKFSNIFSVFLKV